MHILTPELAAIVDLDVARDRLTIQVLDATTLPEIEAATKALRSWIKAHPEDEGMSDAFEQLFILKDIAEEQEAEHRNVVAPPKCDLAMNSDTAHYSFPVVEA